MPERRARRKFTPDGFTPLLFAARVGDIETARLLLAAGADVNETAAISTVDATRQSTDGS